MGKRNNIILIGMPAVGKSSIGVILAKELGYQFLDSDLLIQKREGCLLRDILDRDGIEGFLRIENEVNCSIDEERTVIATGGSAVYGQEAMEHFKEIGTVIYLKTDYGTLEKRLGDLRGRGVVLKEGQTLSDLYRERCPLYEKYADITVEENEKTIEETLQSIKEAISRYNPEQTKGNDPLIKRVCKRSEKDYIIKLCDASFPSGICKRDNYDEIFDKIDKYAEFFVACSEGDVCGYAAMYNNNLVTKAAYITMIAVRDVYQGKQIGSRLMEVCIDSAVKMGMRTIRLEVSKSNLKAAAFYQKTGFVYEKGSLEDRVFMLLDLTDKGM